MTKQNISDQNSHPSPGLGRIQITLVDPAANLKKIEANSAEETFYLSCLTGANTAANIAVEQCQAIRSAWRPGSDYQAKTLVKTFGLVMLSQWFFQLKEAEGVKEKHQQAYRQSAKIFLSLFEANPFQPLFPVLIDKEIDIALRLDEQFRYEIEQEDDMAAYAILLLAWVVQSAGEVVLDWNKVSIPLSDFAHLTKAGAILNEKPFQVAQNLIDILSAQQRGVIAMARFYASMQSTQKETTQTTPPKPNHFTGHTDLSKNQPAHKGSKLGEKKVE